MKMNFEFVKKRPLLTGGVILAGALVLFLVMRGGGAQASQVAVATGPSEAQVAASMQAQQIAAQQQMQVGSWNFQLAQGQQAIMGQLEIAKLQAQLEDNRSLRDSNTQLGLAKMAADIQLTGLNIQGSIAQSNAEVAKMTAQAQAYATMISADNQLPMAQLQAGVMNNQIFYDFRKVEVGAIRDSQVAQHQAQAMIGVAQQQKKAAQSQMWGNVASSLIGGIFKVF